MRALIAFLLLVAAAGRASAGEAAGHAEFEQGSKAYAEADYRTALIAFKRAYDLSERPELLYNIGQCHRHLGEKREAVEVWKHFLELLPQTPDRPEIERIIATLERQNAEEGLDRQQQEAAQKPPSEKPAPTPVYRRWWLWTTIIAVLAIGAGVTAAVLLTSSTPAAPPDPVPPVGAQVIRVQF
jgi:tetratricopeptide (TPR) repeat protein